MNEFTVGEVAYIIESNRYIREGKILRYSGGMYLFRFIEGGGIQVKQHRLFTSEEAAQAELDRLKKNGKKNKDSQWYMH